MTSSLIASSPLMASPPGRHTIAIPTTQHAAVGSSDASPCNPISPQIQEIVNKLQQMQFQRDLNFEVVDDTALINIPDPILTHNPPKNPKKKPKRKGRKDWRKKKTADDRGVSVKKETTARMKYSRADMVALSLENVEYQKEKWAAVYGGLPASVAAEYDGLVVASVGVWKNPGVRAFDVRRRPLLDKFDAAAAMEKTSPLKILVL